MIIQKQRNNLINSLPSNRIFIDPNIYTNFDVTARVIPLITNNSLISLNKNNRNFKNLYNKTYDLIEEGIFIPVSISEENLPDNLVNKKCILRKALVDESLFLQDYKKAIEKDYLDDNFKRLIQNEFQLKQRELTPKISSISHSMNWNLIISQLLETPILSCNKFRNILNYKCNSIVRNYYYPQAMNHLPDIKNFIKKLNPLFPANLDIDQIKSFRKDNKSVQFRNWLNHKLHDIYGKEKFDTIEIDEYLINEFNELSKSYSKKIELISIPLSGIFGGVVGGLLSGSPITGGAIGGLAGSTLGFPLSKIMNEIWKKRGPNPWVFFFDES